MGLALRRARCPISATKRISLLSHVGDWAESGRVVLKMSFVVRDPGCVKTTSQIRIAPLFLGAIDATVH
jgi:hypothetical protein